MFICQQVNKSTRIYANILDVIGIKKLNYKTALKTAVFHSKTLLPITSIEYKKNSTQSHSNHVKDMLTCVGLITNNGTVRLNCGKYGFVICVS